MNFIIDFLLNNYLWFLVISLILIFALIGYLVDASTLKETKTKKGLKTIGENPKEDSFAVHPSVEAYTNEKFDDPLIK